MDKLMTEADLAALLNLPRTTVAKLRRREGWPHLQLGKAIRYSDEHMAAIIARHTVTETPASKPIFEGQRPNRPKRPRS